VEAKSSDLLFARRRDIIREGIGKEKLIKNDIFDFFKFSVGERKFKKRNYE